MPHGSYTDYASLLIVIMAVVFILFKFTVLRLLKIERMGPAIFFYSFRTVNKYALHKYDNGAAKRYLKISNKVNMLFYTAGIGVILMYLFFKYVV